MITYYQRYLRSDWWQARRLYELDRAGHCCEFCGSPDDQLHVHHLAYKRLNQELPEDLIVLCSSCHQDAHDFPGTIGFDIEGLAARRTTRGTYNDLIRWLERFIRSAA